MKTISFSDIKRASWLQGYNEIQLLHPDMDEQVAKVLEQLGVDVEFGVCYYGAQHRNLKGEVVVGYLAAGDVNINRNFINGPFSTLEDRLISSSYTDRSLTQELAQLRGLQRSYEQDSALESEQLVQGPPKGNHVEYNTELEKQIAQLNEICLMIRGPAYSESGSLKTYAEYKQYAQQNNKGNK